jgi:hypothetical protein
MRMLKIEDSSNIDAVGYDGLAVMRVRFKNGGLYEYQNVQPHTFARVLTDESVGKSFHTHVKAMPDKYPPRRIEAEHYRTGQKLMINVRLVKAEVLTSSDGHGLCYLLQLDPTDFTNALGRQVWIKAEEMRDVEELES